MLLQPLAREMVEAVSGLVEGRTINLMDTKGIIVASSDPARVGSFHQGAMEAVRTGKMVNITKEQVPDYSGAREGCNMPLRVNGAIIGVVGIRGDPPEIQALADQLTAGKKTELEKADALCEWIATHIYYDYVDLKAHIDDIKDQSAAAVLERRTAICDGYSALTLAMLRAAGLDAMRRRARATA